MAVHGGIALHADLDRTRCVRQSHVCAFPGVLLERRCPQTPCDPIAGAPRGAGRTAVLRPTGAPPQRPDEALLFLGDDQRGERLEGVGGELADGRPRVIGAMPMRPSYKDLYEEAKACPQ